MNCNNSLFADEPDIHPQLLQNRMTVAEFITSIGKTCFEARNLYRGAKLFEKMILENDTIWLGIAGAGIAGGMGGSVISLMKAGFIDAICSTGAQVYHDLHFAFGLPVKAINPKCDDNLLREHGDTRIYDIGIREKETLEAQDEILCSFIKETHDKIVGRVMSSWEFTYKLGRWVIKNAPHNRNSFVATAAAYEIPIFWDSLSNHSIAMNIARMELDGYPLFLSAQKDIIDSAAISYFSEGTGFVELGGGGPKNFIQQTGPTIKQILNIEYSGAQRGLQIGTAVEREGSLSSCTFGEAVTWGKYRVDNSAELVQIWGEYSILFPLMACYVLETCSTRTHKNILSNLPDKSAQLSEKYLGSIYQKEEYE
ncbi:deoxyhypusine synthase family protein [candidate division CSSED10-310 bacterium]|uniref:Deoxyhypusine synthase family protein n=1 Tax=candidate division CSSED10-310 bacterium TaxID=2855610 RepID=A0ABV6Z6B7_UNCC1